MTPEEERIYLTNLLIDSTAWSVSEGETRSAIELEVIDRLRKLQGQESINVVGKPSDEVLKEDDHKELKAARLNDNLSNKNKAREKWKADKVRCQENGKSVWHPASECHREKLFPDNPKAKKFRWVWDGPQDNKVNKLSDELWEAHENGDDL